MARWLTLRYSYSRAISRRSCSCGRPGAVEDELVDLGSKRASKGVKPVRDKVIERKGVARGYGDAGVGRKPWSTATDRGGTASSNVGSPVALWLWI